MHSFIFVFVFLNARLLQVGIDLFLFFCDYLIQFIWVDFFVFNQFFIFLFGIFICLVVFVFIFEFVFVFVFLIHSFNPICIVELFAVSVFKLKFFEALPLGHSLHSFDDDISYWDLFHGLARDQFSRVEIHQLMTALLISVAL